MSGPDLWCLGISPAPQQVSFFGRTAAWSVGEMCCPERRREIVSATSKAVIGEDRVAAIARRQLEAALDINHCAADEFSGADLVEYLCHILDGDVVDNIQKMPRLAGTT